MMAGFLKGRRWIASVGATVSQLFVAGTLLPIAEACSLTIHVDGFRNGKGVLGSVIFNNQTGWPEDDTHAFRRTARSVSGNSAVTLTLSDIPAGRYAIVVLHDENANHRLDRNMFRVPKEGFGFANNPHVGLSAPTWKASSVQVACPVTAVDIHLIYK